MEGNTAKEDALDYDTAPAKFERGEFRGLVLCLPKDNSKSGCSLFSESLTEKSLSPLRICSRYLTDAENSARVAKAAYQRAHARATRRDCR